MTNEEPSRQTLEAVPGRILTFRTGVSMSPAIRAALWSKGYSQAEHDIGWSILKRISDLPKALNVPVDKAVQEATSELDRWDEPNFEAIQAICERNFPEQGAFLFENLVASQGPGAVLGVETLLERLDALENSPDRKATKKADQAALALLAERGYTDQERARLRGRVKTANTAIAVVATPTNDADRQKALLEGYRWITEWSACARLVITKKSLLIALGLASKKKSRKAAGDAPVAPDGPGLLGAPTIDPAAHKA